MNSMSGRTTPEDAHRKRKFSQKQTMVIKPGEQNYSQHWPGIVTFLDVDLHQLGEGQVSVVLEVVVVHRLRGVDCMRPHCLVYV